MPVSPVDADGLFQVGDEDLAVADLAGVGRLGDRLHGGVEVGFLDGHFDLDLGQEVDHVLRTAIEFGMALLPPEALHLGDGDALHPDLGQRLADLIELERLDYGCD